MTTSSSSSSSSSGKAESQGGAGGSGDEARADDFFKNTRDHMKGAAEDIGKAAEAMFDQMVSPEVRAHMRKAARHALQAGLTALDEADRRAEAAAAERAKRDPPASA